jgi:predicted TIM-barrel fold metal-dependent hydrolase
MSQTAVMDRQTEATKIWAKSGDSHVMEPADLWLQRLPARLAERAPRTEKNEKTETIWVDGEQVFRTLNAFAEAGRPPGTDDLQQRLRDIDREGVLQQILFPSAGLWVMRMRDPELWLAACQAYNDWMAEEVMSVSERFIGAAMLPLASTADAVAELQRAAGLGYRTVMLAVAPPEGREFNNPDWDALWAAAAEADMALSFHVGTGSDPRFGKGPGAVVANYVETFVPGQRTVTQMVTSGALDRHPNLRMFIAEGGASWVPALGDRMDEGYRQHGAFTSPKLSRLPSEIIRDQVYASFQHDVTAIPAYSAMHYPNVLWGDDYPHLEGTYGHTQETLHTLFDGVPEDVQEPILRGNFDRLLGLAS